MEIGEYEELNKGYADLLKVIFLEDTKRKCANNKFLCVYDMFNQERLIAVVSSSAQLAKLTNIKQSTIEHDICTKKLLRNRYKLVRIKID